MNKAYDGEEASLLTLQDTINKVCLDRYKQGFTPFLTPIECEIQNDSGNELFITLTYRLVGGKPMSDVGKASKDFDIFIRRFRSKYNDLEYIAVLEPQANTAWRWNVLEEFKNWRKIEYIHINNNTVIEALWGHGFTKTKSISRVDNIGAYLSAYLASVEINDNNKDKISDAIYKWTGFRY